MNAETIAIVGLITTAVVGLFAVLGPMLNGRWERRHQKELARSAARRSRRDLAYADFSAYLERMRLQVSRIEAFWVESQRVGPPERPTDQEWMALTGRLRVSASPEVQLAIQEAHLACNEFIDKVREYRADRESREGELKSRGMEMEDARKHALEAINHAQALMNAELDSL